MIIGVSILSAALILLVIFLVIRKKSRNEADEGKLGDESESE